MILHKKIGKRKTLNDRFRFYIFVLAILTFVTPIFADFTVDIEIKPEYKIGEIITFNYSITSSISTNITYFSLVNCPKALEPLLELKRAKVERGVALKGTYTYLEINEDTEPQTCEASITLTEPFEYTTSKNFSIVTTPGFNFSVLVCKDQLCIKKSKIFVKNQKIYLDYSSEVKNISINANLTYPDKTIKQLTLPTSIKAEQTGTYTLKVTASKEGYKTKALSTQFGVVEKEAEIINTSSCFVNSICEPDLGENYKTCPQDCEPCAKDNICNPDCLTGEDADCKQTTFPYWLLIIGLVIALFLLIILVRHITDRL